MAWRGDGLEARSAAQVIVSASFCPFKFAAAHRRRPLGLPSLRHGGGERGGRSRWLCVCVFVCVCDYRRDAISSSNTASVRTQCRSGGSREGEGEGGRPRTRDRRVKRIWTWQSTGRSSLADGGMKHIKNRISLCQVRAKIDAGVSGKCVSVKSARVPA